VELNISTGGRGLLEKELEEEKVQNRRMVTKLETREKKKKAETGKKAALQP